MPISRAGARAALGDAPHHSLKSQSQSQSKPVQQAAQGPALHAERAAATPTLLGRPVDGMEGDGPCGHLWAVQVVSKRRQHRLADHLGALQGGWGERKGTAR